VKLFCLLLSVYVLLLTASPCCTGDDCQDKAGSKKEHTDKASKDKDCAGCSAFFTCGSCAGFILNKHFSIALPTVAESHPREYAPYQQPALQNTARAIWLPPKLS
jgi:hypothetical protein